MRRIAYVVLIVSSLAILAACSDYRTASPFPSGGSPSGDTSNASAPTSSTQTLPYAGAPKVTNPLPASVLDGNPCQTALTPEQVTQALGISVAGKPDSVSAGPSCAWPNLDSGARVAVGYTTGTHTGLSGVYANTKPKTKTWKELSPIRGYPAVAYDINDSTCHVTVGLADDLSIDVSGTLSYDRVGSADPCASTAKAAAVVIDNLKKKAG